MFSPLICNRWAVEAPENLVLLTGDELIRTYRQSGCDRQSAGACLGELVIRWLVGDSDRGEAKAIERFLREVSPDESIPDGLLTLRLDPSPDKIPSRIWNDKGDVDQSVVEPMVRERLASLFSSVDGYVPVYSLEDRSAAFVPFHLELAAREGIAAIDASGRVIEAWNAAAGQVLGPKWCMKVHYRQRQDAPALVGRSFMLPLQVALWKHEGKLPAFSPWALLFTGVIEVDRGVLPVQTDEKQRGVEARFQHDVKLVAPSDVDFAEETSGIDAIPAGLVGENLLKAVRARIEALSQSWMSRSYILHRLPDFDFEIRHETLHGWDCQIACADEMMKVLGRISAPKQYLRLLMLKSAAYCHSGRTSQALLTNRQAREFAEANGLVYESLRLAIEELVEFQDSQRFDEILQLANVLDERISSAKVTESENLDLRMRFNGTMGQVQMERGLLGLDSEAIRKAKQLLREAVFCANELESLEPGKYSGEVLQDVNYLFLWYVLFDPESPDLQECKEEMLTNCRRLESESERIKNSAYESRQLMLMAYLRWKRTGEVSEGWERIPAPARGSESWLAASFWKMKGALLASAGQSAYALAAFDSGNAALPVRDWWKDQEDLLSSGGVFAQIRLELLVQAFCSLSALGRNEAAEDYRNQARSLIDELPGVRKRIGFSELEKLLISPEKSDPKTLPVLYY